MLTLLLTLHPNPDYMPLRYISYKCITTPLALTSLGTPNLHSSPMWNKVWAEGRLPPNWKLEQLYLIPKRGKDKPRMLCLLNHISH